MDKTYKGQLHWGHWENDCIMLDSYDDPLMEIIEGDLLEYGNYTTVKYFISEKEMTKDELITQHLLNVIGGETEAEFNVASSEVTGYLWTDNKLRVGGHDLSDEFGSAACDKKYLYLEISYSKEPKSDKNA